MKTIPLTKGKVALVDAALAPALGSAAEQIITPSDAYDQGYGARLCGKAKDFNPYVQNTEPWKWFNTGWDEAEPEPQNAPDQRPGATKV